MNDRNRMWVLVATQPDLEIEYVVTDRQVGPLLSSIASDPSVRNVRCVPLAASTCEGVWMASRAPRAA